MSDERSPIVLMPARPWTTDDPTPTRMASARRLATEHGWRELGVTWAVALVWRNRQMPGAKGQGSMRPVQMPLTSVAARWRSADDSCLAYLTWWRYGEEGWRGNGGSIVSAVEGVRWMLEADMRDLLALGGPLAVPS